MKSSLYKRWLTALIAGPLVVLFVCFGSDLFFTLFIGILIILAVLEYSRMNFGPEARAELTEGIASALLISAAAYCANGRMLAGAVTALIILSTICYMFQYQMKADSTRPDLSVPGKKIIGFIALPLLLSHLIMLRGVADGIAWILLMFVVVVSGDSAAFFIGTKFGKRKLMVAISPAKTYEGAVASLLAGILMAFLYACYFLPALSWGHVLVASALTNIFAQLGDLSESMMKRSAGAKDSGALLPGHGGVLDRLDAFLFAAPVLYYYKVLFIG